MATIISAREIAGLRDVEGFEQARSRIREKVDAILAKNTTAKRSFQAGKSNTHPEVTVEASKEALCRGFGSPEEDFHVFGNTIRRMRLLFRKAPGNK